MLPLLLDAILQAKLLNFSRTSLSEGEPGQTSNNFISAVFVGKLHL